MLPSVNKVVTYCLPACLPGRPAARAEIRNETVGKQSQITQVLVAILAWQKSKAQRRVKIVYNDVHIAETLTKGTRGLTLRKCCS